MSMLKKGMYAAQSTVDVIDPEPVNGYITFSSDAPFSIKFNQKSWDGVLKYSTDMVNWQELDASEISSVNNKIFLCGLGNSIITGVNTASSAMTITSPTDSGVSCTGNIMALLDHVSPETAVMGELCFSMMFYGCTNLTVAPELPATELAGYCYAHMFQGCTNLTTAPELPATQLEYFCYYTMFRGCTNLTIAPELPATVLANNCYHTMFYGCINLTTAPELPATVLAGYCYMHMFSGCISLTAAPELPATVLANDCYGYMFRGTGIKISETQTGSYQTPWRMPSAGTIASASPSWNSNMLSGTGGTFNGNPNINTTYYQAGVEVIDPEPDNRYLTFTGDLPFKIYSNIPGADGILQYSHNATDWTVWDGNTISSVSNQIFLRGIGGTVVNSILQISWDGGIRPAVSCTGNIMTLLDYNSPDDVVMGNECFSRLFYMQTALIEAPQLPANILSENCYARMFYGTSITNAPALPATTLSDGCYSNMFNGCESLIEAPELPATVMSAMCYTYMFNMCTKLIVPPALPALILAEKCYQMMFYGCTAMTSAPNLPATTLATYCYSSMFEFCTSLTLLPALPATVLEFGCYDSMFRDCTGIKVSSVSSGSYPLIWKIPSVGIASEAPGWNGFMLRGTGGTFTNDPAINTTYYQAG